MDFLYAESDPQGVSGSRCSGPILRCLNQPVNKGKRGETRENNDVYGPDTHLGPVLLLHPESLFLIPPSWIHSMGSSVHCLTFYKD